MAQVMHAHKVAKGKKTVTLQNQRRTKERREDKRKEKRVCIKEHATAGIVRTGESARVFVNKQFELPSIVG